MDERNVQPLPQNLIVEDRKKLSVTGVSDVDSFDERTITAFTELGELRVQGADLHITNLCVETGELTVDGRIDALIYAQEQPKNGGFFARMFR